MNNFTNGFNDRCPPNAEPGLGDINVMVKPSSLKSKTPMCLVNELARYNRIQHQYKLTKEEGPPHRKAFTVTLKLGDTEFEAQSSSIKKAQHEAASIALRNTKYKHPPPKLLPNTRVNTTPTVELNAIAMKRGEPTVYTMLSQPTTTYFQPQYLLSYYSRSVYQTRSMYNGYNRNQFDLINNRSYAGPQLNNRYKYPQPFKISLKIGNREYIAEGSTAQAARHKAAKKALEDLRNLPLPVENVSIDSAVHVSDESKSPVSVVHERAFRYDMQATFEVIDERGPPHMRTFITECKVGDQFRTMGEGHGKKLSKRKAAEKMLDLLQSLPPPLPKPPATKFDKRRFTKKKPLTEKKTSRAIRDPSQFNESNQENKPVEVNPIARLVEYQKKKHGKEPVYALVEEKGRGKRKQFSIEVTIDDFKCVGVGTNKKDAKRRASEEMLKLLGLEPDKKSDDTLKIPKPETNKETVQQNNSFPTTVVNGKQLAPGLLLVPNVNLSLQPNSKQRNSTHKEDCTKMANGTSHYIQQPYTNFKQKLWESMNIQKNIAKEQLIRLADTFGYEVKFSDFPKGNHHQEFLSLVTLNTSPPQTCYGSGVSTDTAQNEAAFNALSMISEMGIENVFTKRVSSYIPEKEIVS